MKRPGHIAVEGPIGVGKSTLVKLLAERFEARAVFEDPAGNPFLPLFYRNRKKYAFTTQISFLMSRHQQLKELAQQELFSQATVCDYLFQKDRIFAYLNLSENELHLYEQIFDILAKDIVVRPDLVIYLVASTKVLQRRIKKRSQRYEKDVTPEYLEDLTQAYNRFFFAYDDSPLLIVNTTDIDFVANPSDLEGLVREIETMGSGVRQYIPLGSE